MAEKKAQKRVPGYKSENQKYKSLLVMQYILKMPMMNTLSPSDKLKTTLPSTASRQSGAPSIGTFMP